MRRAECSSIRGAKLQRIFTVINVQFSSQQFIFLINFPYHLAPEWGGKNTHRIASVCGRKLLGETDRLITRLGWNESLWVDIWDKMGQVGFLSELQALEAYFPPTIHMGSCILMFSGQVCQKISEFFKNGE